MMQGPVVHRRVEVGGPPSDLPEQPLQYPGKPLAHRFKPTEQPRKFEEAGGLPELGVAFTTPFEPVASIKYPDKNIHIGRVNNTHPRSLTPVGLSGRVLLPVGGAGIFELSEEIRRPLEARVERLNPFPKGEPQRAPTVQTQVPTPVQQGSQPSQVPTNTTAQTVHTELEKVKESARQELAKRAPQPPQTQLPSGVQPPTQAPPSPLPVQPKQTLFPATASTPEVGTTLGPEEETQKLLSEAEKLENQLSQLRQGIAPPPKGPTQPAPIMPPSLIVEPKPTPIGDEHLPQIDQLIADKSRLLKQVDDLNKSYNLEVQKSQALETKLESLTDQFTRELGQIKFERGGLLDQIQKQEQEAARASQNQAISYTQAQEIAGLKTRILNAEKERDILKTNLQEQAQRLEQKTAEMNQKQLLTERQTEEIAELKSNILGVERERDEAKNRLSKLASVVEELGTKAEKREEEPSHMVEPQVVEEPMEQKPSARIVEPQLAVGKMAPALTSAPNVINGIVKDKEGLLLSNVVIVVKDSDGQPVRALKTNKIGQFAISTPLPNGVYTMELESPGHGFDVIQVKVDGKVMPPIEIRAAG
ncbi:MAG TPA: hypothetical protein VF303_00190 [Candidatus Nanoarchaeia archaeon]